MKNLTSLTTNIRRSLGLAVEFAPSLTFGIFGLITVSYLAPLFQAKLLGDIVNRIVASLQSHILGPVVGLVLLYAGVWGLIRVMSAFQAYLEKLWHMETEHGLELLVLKKRSEIDLGHYENADFQNLLHRAFNNGIWPVFQLADAQFQTVGNIAVVLISSIITSALSWQLYVIIIATSIPSFVVQLKYGYETWGIWAEHSSRQRLYYSMRAHLQSRAGVTQARILQNSPRLLSIIEETLESFKHDNTKTDRKRFWLQTGASLIAAVGFGLSLWIIAREVVSGQIDIGYMVFVISALGSLIGSLNAVLYQLAVELEKNLYVADIFKVLDTKPFITRASHPIKLDLEAPPIIEFRRVSFKYEGREDWILRNVNLTFLPGEKVALVGMNGAGKSTLVKLLSRIYDPTEGQVLVNGVDLRELDLDEWSSYLSVLLQDYLTYDLTVKESIGMGRIEHALDLERVEAASSQSGAHEFISGWQRRYEQQLGKEFEGGIEPSKGQQQKIALARTIYRHGYVMVLDEPTAAIDALSEMKIFEAMERAVGTHTLIVITHRFNTTQSFDKIVVLDHGSVAETGSHQELLRRGGLYQEMFESQAKAFREKPVSSESGQEER